VFSTGPSFYSVSFFPLAYTFWRIGSVRIFVFPFFPCQTTFNWGLEAMRKVPESVQNLTMAPHWASPPLAPSPASGLWLSLTSPQNLHRDFPSAWRKPPYEVEGLPSLPTPSFFAMVRFPTAKHPLFFLSSSTTSEALGAGLFLEGPPRMPKLFCWVWFFYPNHTGCPLDAHQKHTSCPVP